MTKIHRRTWRGPKGTMSAYRVAYTAGGKRRFRQFNLRREAQDFIETLAERRRELEAEADEGPALGEVAESWLQACARGRDGNPPLEYTTIRTYEGYVRNYLRPMLGDRRVRSLTHQDVRAFRERLLEDAKIGRTTARKILVALKGILQWCLDEGLITANPAASVKLRSGGRHAKPVEIPTRAEMGRLIAAASRLAASKDKRVSKAWAQYEALFLLLAGGGLRLSEARGLPRDAVHSGWVDIRQRADRHGVIGPPKSARSRRRVYLGPPVLQSLLKAAERHDGPLLFCRRNGQPLDGQNINKRMWAPLCREARVSGYTLHSLRHYYASSLIAAGQSAKEVSAALGHADEGFTLRVYGHLFKDEATERRRQSAAAQVLVLSGPT